MPPDCVVPHVTFVCEVTVRYWLPASSMETAAPLPVNQTDGRLTT